MYKTQMHVRIDLEKARKLGYEILQNDNRFLELSCEAREFAPDLIVESLKDQEFTNSEVSVVLDTIFEISQMKMLKKIIG